MLIRDAGGMGQLVDINEGGTQGDPLEIMVCGIRFLTLSRELREAHQQVTQP